MQNMPGRAYGPSEQRDDTTETFMWSEKDAPIPIGPTTELPAGIERKLLQAAIFRIIGKSADTLGANTFERAIADLEQQIRDTPFAVHLMSLRLKELASK